MIEACAAAHGVSTRSAREWRRRRDPRWLAFLAERASMASSQPVLPLAGAPAITPEAEEVAAQTRFQNLQALADAAVERADGVAAERLLKAAEASHRLLVACRAARMAHAAESGELGRAEVERVVAVSRQAALLVRQLPHRLAEACNPADPEHARRALQAWIDGDFARAIRAAIHPQTQHELQPDQTPD